MVWQIVLSFEFLKSIFPHNNILRKRDRNQKENGFRKRQIVGIDIEFLRTSTHRTGLIAFKGLLYKSKHIQ